MDLLEQRKLNHIRVSMEESRGLYHSFRLPDGRILRGANALEFLEERVATFGLAEDLRGKQLLDIGPWDGYFTFEMGRRGAEVTAIDYVDLDTFRALHKVSKSSARYLRMDVFELSPERVGTFDIVLCLGVLYHLRYPIEGLEKICAITRDVCIVDTFVSDGDAWLAGERPAIPTSEFFERRELGGQFDNWWGPSVDVVAAWIRTAGFARAEVLWVGTAAARYAAHRHWDLPVATKAAIRLVGISHHLNRGRTFQSSKEEYIALWVEWPNEEPAALDVVYPEVDGFGAPPLFCSVHAGQMQISIHVPPGLGVGRHDVRVRIGAADWSEAHAFYLDLAAIDTPIRVLSVQDGVTWSSEEVDWENGGWMTVWLEGLTAEADAGNVIVFVNGVPHTPQDVLAVSGQVNLQLRAVIVNGVHQMYAEHRGSRSAAVPLKIVGAAPTIRGLEQLELLGE
ncbi:MAG: DUF1698 domain-containing protein [Bryobacteraceae bacterium]